MAGIFDLQGRHAVVTGGGRGIGRAIAAALTAAGADVTIIGRTVSALDETVASGAAGRSLMADVTDRAAISNALAAAAAAVGPVDILVNNAGSVQTAAFVKAPSDQFREMFEVHVMGAVHPSQAVLPAMIARGFGRIINVASTTSFKAYPYVAAYGAAKHALLGLTRVMAVENARSGVTVNAICPGYTETELVLDSVRRTAARTGRAEADTLAGLTDGKPLGRLIRPDEVAAAVVWLASAAAGAVNGAAIPIEGGELVA